MHFFKSRNESRKGTAQQSHTNNVAHYLIHDTGGYGTGVMVSPSA